MLIDNITLSVFEDSGWYRVNYAVADNFIWGQGSGHGLFLSSLNSIVYYSRS